MVKVTETTFNRVAETDPGYGQLFAILMRRRFWLLGVLGIVLVVAAVITRLTKPTYESSMQLLIEPNYQGKGEKTLDQYADSDVAIDYATQLNVMRSPLLLQQAVDLLSSEYPNITVDEIKKYLVLNQVVEDKVDTKIVRAEYVAHDPVKAQMVLESLEKVYELYNKNEQAQRLNNGLKFINEQLPNVQNDVERAEKKLEKFRKGQNLIDPVQQATAISASLNTLQQEREANHTQYKDVQARSIALQQQLDRSPQNALISSRLSQSIRYQTLLNEIQKTELALAQQRLRFTDSAPNVQILLEQRQRQQDLLQNEVKRVLGQVPPQLSNAGQSLLQQGQLNGIDINLTAQLVEAQTNLRAIVARDQSLAQVEQGLRGQINRFPALIAQYNQLIPELQINRDKLDQLLKARQDLSLQLARQGFAWQSLEQPKRGLKIGPSLKRNLLLGAVAGLLLGGIAAFLREMVDDSVHSCEDLEKQVDLPLLGMTPEFPRSKVKEPLIRLPFGEPQVSSEPWTVQVINWPPSWESLDLVYKNIELLSAVSAFRSLMVTSAIAGEGKSTLALGLALSAARLHQRVLLIDADLRCPNLHKQLNLPNEQGLSTILTSDVSLPIHSGIESSGSYIDILTAGPTPTDPANLLSSQRMRELMSVFEQNYDLVLLDAPPVLGMVDAILAASFCSGVVLVARIGQVTRSELAQATAMLSKLNIIGVVANDTVGSSKVYAPYYKQNEVVLQQSFGK